MMANNSRQSGRKSGARKSPPRPRVQEYQRNALWDLVKDRAIWLLFNFRYAFIFTIGLGGRLADLPKQSERTFVAGLLIIYGILLGVSALFNLNVLISLSLPLMIGLPPAYVVGGYYIMMEYRGGESLVGTALAIDLILNTGNLIPQVLNVILFAFFLLICVEDWRDIIRLPGKDGAQSGKPSSQSSSPK